MFKGILIRLNNLSPAAIREIIVIIIILCISIALSLPQLKEDLEKAKTLNETTIEGEADYGIFRD